MPVAAIDVYVGLGAGMVLRTHTILRTDDADLPVSHMWELTHHGRTARGWFQLRHTDLRPLVAKLHGEPYAVVLTALTLARYWAANDLCGVLECARQLCA